MIDIDTNANLADDLSPDELERVAGGGDLNAPLGCPHPFDPTHWNPLDLARVCW